MQKGLFFAVGLASVGWMSALAQDDPAAARLQFLNTHFKNVKIIEADTPKSDSPWTEASVQLVSTLATEFLKLPRNEMPLAQAKKMDTPYVVLEKFSWQELKEQPLQPAFLDQIEEIDAAGALEAGKPIFRELPPGSNPQALRSALNTVLEKLPMSKRRMPNSGYKLVADEGDWLNSGVDKIHEQWKTIANYRVGMEDRITSLKDFPQGKVGEHSWLLDEVGVAKLQLPTPPECATEIADMLGEWNSLCALYLPLKPAEDGHRTWHQRVVQMAGKLDVLKAKGAVLAEGKKKEEQMKLLDDMKAKLLPQYQLVQRLCLATQEAAGYGEGLRVDLDRQLGELKVAYGKYAAEEPSTETPSPLENLNLKWKSVQLTLLRLVRLELTLHTLGQEVGERMVQYQKLLTENRDQMRRWIDMAVTRRAAHAMADWQEAKSSATVQLDFNDRTPFIQELNFPTEPASFKAAVYAQLLKSSKPLEFEPWTLGKVAEVMASETTEKGKPRVFFGSRIKLTGKWKVTGNGATENLTEAGKHVLPSILIIALDASFAPDFDLHVVEGGKFILVTQQMLGIDAGSAQDALLPTVAQWPTFRTEGPNSGIYLQSRLSVPMTCRRHGQNVRANADDDIVLQLRQRIWGETMYDHFYYQLASRISEDLSQIDTTDDTKIPEAVELASTLLRAKPAPGTRLEDFSRQQLPGFVKVARDTLNVERLVVISGRYPHGIPALQIKQAPGPEPSPVVPLPAHLRLASAFSRPTAVGTGKFQGNTIQFETGPIELVPETQIFSRTKTAIERSGSAYVARARNDNAHYVAELDPDRFTAFEQSLSDEGIKVVRKTGTGGVVTSFTVEIAGTDQEVYLKLLKLYSPHPAIQVPVRVVSKTGSVLPGGSYGIPFSFRFILPNADVEDMIAKNVLIAPAEGDYLVRVPPPAIDEAIVDKENEQPTYWELNFQALRLANYFPGKGGIQGALLDTVRSTITIEQPAGPPDAWRGKQGYGPQTLQKLLSDYPDGVLKLTTLDKQLRVTLVARSQRTAQEEMVTLSDVFQFGKVQYVDVEKRIAEKYTEQLGQ